jgi:soluble lytic murein transglycosylase-like protein
MIYLSAKTVFKNDYVLMKNYGQLAAMHIDIKDVLTFSALLKKIIKIENAHIKTLNKIREHKVFKRQRMSFDEIKDYALVLYWWHIKYKLNINYFIANTIAESDMMPNVTSKAGAKGLNQIILMFLKTSMPIF